MADLIAAFGVGRAHLVGHAMGAAVAITLAANHPELVQRLVLEDALCYPFPMSFKMKLPLLPIVGGIVFKQLHGRGTFRSYFRDDVFRADAAVPLSRVDRHYDLFNAPSARESAHAVMRAVLDARPRRRAPHPDHGADPRRVGARRSHLPGGERAAARPRDLRRDARDHGRRALAPRGAAGGVRRARDAVPRRKR